MIIALLLKQDATHRVCTSGRRARQTFAMLGSQMAPERQVQTSCKRRLTAADFKGRCYSNKRPELGTNIVACACEEVLSMPFTAKLLVVKKQEPTP